MRAVVLASALLALAAAAFPVLRQTTFGGPAVPDPKRTCTSSGGKCAGSSNNPFVAYAPCCGSGDVCGELITPDPNLWGLFCGPPSLVKAAAVSSPVATATVTTVTTTASPVSTKESATTATTEPTTTAASSTPLVSSSSTAIVTPVPTPAVTPKATPIATPTLVPSATPKSNSSSNCFPSSASVELSDGSFVPMSKLSIGDMVNVGPNSYSEVFMFTHKVAGGLYEFVELTTSTGAVLSLTSGHYIPVDGSLVAASDVSVGAPVQLANGVSDKVISIRTIVDSGLYNPQTLHGNIVVNGVVASTYTTAVEPRFAHAVLAPLRSLFSTLGLSMVSLESGGGLLADVAPRGDVVLC